MEPVVGIVLSPPPAQSLARQKSRRLLGRSTAREGGFIFSRAVLVATLATSMRNA